MQTLAAELVRLAHSVAGTAKAGQLAEGLSLALSILEAGRSSAVEPRPALTPGLISALDGVATGLRSAAEHLAHVADHARVIRPPH